MVLTLVINYSDMGLEKLVEKLEKIITSMIKCNKVVESGIDEMSERSKEKERRDKDLLQLLLTQRTK